MINEFTNEKIDDAGVENWDSASVSELYRQRSVLMNRLTIAHTLGKVPIVNQLHAALSALDAQIKHAQQRPASPLKKRGSPNDPTAIPTPSFD